MVTMIRTTHKLIAVVAAFVTLGTSTQTASAQFELGYSDLGATIGLGGIGSASLAFGGRFEMALKALPDLGNGIVGIQAAADYYSWSSGFFSYSYIPVGATANYHFKLQNTKIDPFLGLGLGYSIISCDYTGPFGQDVCANSAIYFIGKAGIRYFASPRLAIYGDVGAGAATINVGAMFRLK
jgi:hypothetical protein